jgi:hypothetical protein
MTILRILIVLTFSVCLFLNAQAQSSVGCEGRVGLVENPDTLFPNELKGFEFYGKGKLKSLKLYVSTIKEVEKVFGTPVRKVSHWSEYDYDSDWSVMFGYFDLKYVRVITAFSYNSDARSRVLVPKPELIGKIYQIKLIPKKIIPMGQMSFSDEFKKQSYLLKGIGSMKDHKYNLYQDRYGLSYQFFDRKDGDDKPLRSQDNLEAIDYVYPCLKDENIYIEKR